MWIYVTIDTMPPWYLTDGERTGRAALCPARSRAGAIRVSYHERLKPSCYILQKLWQ
ncbi:MAG: hypothetical protein ACLUEU_13655 [Oscillospiraceae bacterium]